MRTLITAFLLLALPGAALAQRHYAVLSLVGDELMIVQREMMVGSHLDTNSRQSVTMPDASIDRAMLLAVDEAVRRAEPGAQTSLLVSRRQSVYDAVARAIDKNGPTAAAYEAVKPLVANARGATHLILITKHRSPTRVRIPNGTIGHGTLEGVGFYVDYGSTARGYITTDAERGVISPYAYARVSLIEVSSGRVLAEHVMQGSKGYTVDSGTIGDAWHVLSAQEKDKRLHDLLREEAARAVPMVLAVR